MWSDTWMLPGGGMWQSSLTIKSIEWQLPGLRHNENRNESRRKLRAETCRDERAYIVTKRVNRLVLLQLR